MIKTPYLFLACFCAICIVYYFVFGIDKSILIITGEYWLILALIPAFLVYLFLRLKLKKFGIKNFNFTNNTNISLKSTIIFFLIFQVVDYYSEDGFLGMISLWFMYFIMGLLGYFVIESMQYFKIYKMLKSKL